MFSGIMAVICRTVVNRLASGKLVIQLKFWPHTAFNNAVFDATISPESFQAHSFLVAVFCDPLETFVVFILATSIK